jgi:hypothetical protein
MKFLKQKTLSKFSPTDQTLFTNQYGRAVMEITGGLRLPKGTTAQRPQTTGVRTTGDANGFIRYNTTKNSVEAYINGVWTTVRASGATAITKQTIGPGNLSETKFGPLNTVDAGTSYLASADNIIVLIENVMQISTTNYTIVQNPAGNALATYGSVTSGQPYPTGYYLQFGSAVPVGKYVTVYYGYSD